MTELDLSPTADLADFEIDLREGLAVPSDVADLLFRDAHTANAFADSPVTDQQMRAIYDLVKWGPTAMNSQPLRVVLVRSAEAHERLVKHMSDGNKAKTAAAPLVAVLAADVDFHDKFHKTFPVFPGARDAFADEEARLGVATLNASLQIGYFLIGVRAAGLAAGPMAGFDRAGIDREFFPDANHRSLLVVNIGRPTEQSYRARQPRLDFDDVIVTA